MSSARHANSTQVEHEGVVPLPRNATEFQGFGPAHLAPAVAAPPAPAPQPERQSLADKAFIGTLTAIASLLASRLILLLATIGSFVLAVRADTQAGLYVLIAYSVLIVLPLVTLDVLTKRRGSM
jgi:hypothetical protein